MTQVVDGNTVKVHYTGTLDDGTEFDTSHDRDPLEFTIGQGKIIPGFEQAVIGMEEGESKTATIPADKAYGPYHDDMVLVVDRDHFPDHIDPHVGQQLEIRKEEGTVPVTVTEVSKAKVTLDANHPLAGQDLTFEIELVKIV